MTLPNNFDPQSQPPQRPAAQPVGRVFATLLREPPMNLSVLGAIFFLVNVILIPGGLFFNFLFAALAAFIVYQQVRQAELLVAIRGDDSSLTTPYTSQVLAKPTWPVVFGQMFRSVFNLIFLVAIGLTAVPLYDYATQTPTNVLGVVGSVALILAYIFFMVGNGYVRAQALVAGKKPTAFM